jgi:GTP-dependent phosphoenolpyruvate carboxykinase
MNPFAGDILTLSVETWVELVAAHTTPARVQWLTDSADCAGIALTSATSQSRAERPVPIMSSRHRAGISASSKFLNRAMATARFWPTFGGAMSGRVMYVLPYVLGGNCRARSAGVQITDDPLHATILGRTVELDASLRRASYVVRSLHAVEAECPPTICCFSDARAIWAPAVSAADFIDARVHALRLASLEVLPMGYVPARVTIVRLPSSPGGRPLICGVIAPGEFGRAPGALLGLSQRRTAYPVVAASAAWLTVEDGELCAVLCEKPPMSDLGDDILAAPGPLRLDALVFCTRRAHTVPVVLINPGGSRPATPAPRCHPMPG